ncbi:MAG: hypothetical protein COV45_03675 [Deltaproteobacteria bacterium CG11_big_fil_rev_8_21_14_0_20_47_16]|nr:MAG: hypothetical protein COV45_03675 [Deltaproteobacteria bacterium CG11_big_fil_rev_8_21_14_0_20_47_16]
MNKRPPTQFTLNQVLACILLVGACATIGIGYVMVNKEAERYNTAWRNDNLSKSAAYTSSYYAVITPKIILDKQDEVNNLLQGIKEGEGLRAAYILPQSAISTHVLETCQVGSFKTYFRQSPTCYEYTPTSFRIYHELLSAGQNVGYLVKEMDLKPFQRFRNTAFLQYLTLVLIWLVAIVIAALFILRQFVMRPTKRMIELIKGGDDIGIGVNNFRLKELRALALSLQKSLNANKEYQEQAKQLEFDAELGKLSSRVAHDIRSPLSSMRAALMLLRDKFGNDKDAEELFNLLQLSSNRLDNIANGLLSNHMGESAAEQLFSIHEVLDELIGELRASPLGQGTEFKKQYHTEALYVTGDKTGMARAIGNIIKNALEAMQQNTSDKVKQLTVSTTLKTPSPQTSPTGGEGVSIRITDTGPGIPADKISLILQGGHSEGKEDGHGIGTKVVRDMVDAHKGSLAIESKVGVGTTFIITLPATIQNEEMLITIPVNADSKVVVIDDESSLREQWRLTLKAQGVTPEIYTCWEEYASALPPHPGPLPQGEGNTFIIDYHFDNSIVDGLEIIRRLKEKGAVQCVLATAEYWKPAIKEAAQKLNVTLCPKPLPKVVVRSLDSSVATLPQNDKAGHTVLLIDDDNAIRVTWNALKNRLGIVTLHSFPNLEAAIQADIDLASCDLCVIDKNIENSQYNGAQMLGYLKENGARRVVLATGENESDVRRDPAYHAVDGILFGKIPETLTEFL